MTSELPQRNRTDSEGGEGGSLRLDGTHSLTSRRLTAKGNNSCLENLQHG
jgi:hypothetical protein